METINKELTKEDCLETIKDIIVKEKTLDSLSRILGKSELEVMGYIRELKDKGMNISYFEKDGNAYVVRNDHPDLAKENVYRIEEDLDSHTKVAFISELRFGSKNEQIAVLNDMYRKFASEGVRVYLWDQRI